MPFVKTIKAELYYETSGDSETPLIIIGGLGDNTRNWTLYLNFFSKYFRTIVFDARDSGLSTKFITPYGLSDMTDDLQHLILDLGLSQVNLLGFSMGGKVAIDLALKAPQLINRMILVSTSASAEHNQMIQNIIPVSSSKEDLEIFYQKQFELLFSTNYRSKFPASSFVKYKINDPHPQPLQSFQNQLLALKHFHLPERDLRLIPHKSLILCGDDDPIHSIESAQMLHKHLPSSELNVYLGAGHVLQADEPVKFRESVVNFLL